METLTGQKIEFSTIPVEKKPLINVKFTEAQTEQFKLENGKLLNKGLIAFCTREEISFLGKLTMLLKPAFHMRGSMAIPQLFLLMTPG